MPNAILNYTILLKTSTEKVAALLTALNFCEGLVVEKHYSIHCLFLQCEAAYLGIANPISLEDEICIQQQWQDFIKNHNIPTFICSNSALRRGIVDQEFAKIYHRESNLASMFKLANLGTLFTAIETSDRFIQL